MDINYDKVISYAYNVASKYINDKDKAQDVAQLSAIQLFLNRDKIDNDKLHNWLFTVTKNFCLKQLSCSQKGKEVILAPSFFDNVSIDEVDDNCFKLDFSQYDFFNQSDKELLHKYYNEHFVVADLAKAYKIKIKKLKDKIYRLTQEIILFKKMQNQEFSSSISGTKLHNNIYYFLGKFIKAIKENRLTDFSRNLTDCKINDTINDIKIRSVKKITIDFCSEDYYKGLIFYINFEEQVKVFLFNFQIINRNKIKILEFPILPKYVFSHSVDNTPPELKDALKLNKKGKANLSSKQLIELAKQNKLKVVQAKDGILD